MGEKAPRKRRLVKGIGCAVVCLALLALGGAATLGIYNCHMHAEVMREGQRIGTDDDYGAAWETIDHVGEGDLGVLFFHNLHGTPRDYDILYGELWKHGIHTYAPMLGGERPSPAVQNGFTAATFATHAEKAYEHLAQRCSRIIVLGSSAGGVQAADVASRYPVERVILVAPAFGIVQPLHLKWSTETCTRRLAPILPIVRKRKKSNINDEEALARFKGFQLMALGGATAFLDYVPGVIARVDAINAPVLCLLSHKDVVADVTTAEETVARMSSAEKRIEYIDESNHMILIDYGRERAAEMVMEFILESLNTK